MARKPTKKSDDGDKAKILDQLYTPDALARKLVKYLPIRDDMDALEPSVGGGAFARALLAKVSTVVGVDVDPAAVGLSLPGVIPLVGNFLDVANDWSSASGDLAALPDTAIVGNPPFSGDCGAPHVRAALRLVFGPTEKPRRDVAARGCVGMLVPTDFLSGVKRASWLKDNRPQRIVYLYPRPKFHGPADKGKGGMQNICFLVWANNMLTLPPEWLDIRSL